MNKLDKEGEGFFIDSEKIKSKKIMVLTGPWKSEFKDIMEREDIDGLRLSKSVGWRDTDISFILDIQDLTSLAIYNYDVIDIRLLEKMPNLEHVGVYCNPKHKINFSKLKKLQYAYLHWSLRYESIFECKTLEYLNFENLRGLDLTALKELTNLHTLKISSRTLKSLHGIEVLTKLKDLDLFDCRQLLSLEGLEKLPQLKRLEIECVKKIEDIEALRELVNLEYLRVDNCGKIESLDPIHHCKKLETFFFTDSTNILDGDLNPIIELEKENLKDTAFQQRKHYTHKWADLSSNSGIEGFDFNIDDYIVDSFDDE